MTSSAPAGTGAEGHRDGARGGGLAVIDQILSSASALLLVVLVARRSSTATFGALSVALLVNGFLLGSVRSLVGEVALIRCRRAGASLADEARLTFSLASGAGLASALATFAAGSLVGGEAGSDLRLVALGIPFVFVQDVHRYLAYGMGRVDKAVVLDGVWLGVQAAASVTLIVLDRASPSTLVLAWALGAGAGALYGWIRGGAPAPRAHGFSAWLREDGSRAAGFLSDFVVSTGLVQTSFLILGAILAANQFGELRLAYVSVSPLANVIAGVRVLTMSRLAGLRPAPALHVARRFAVGYALLAVGYGTALRLLPLSVAQEIFGPSWAEARTLASVVVIGEVLRLSTFPAVDYLKVFGSPSVLVKTRSFNAVGVVTGILLGGITAGPRGAATGSAIAIGGAAVVWWIRVLAFERRRSF